MDFDGNIEDRLGTARADLESRILRTPADPVRTFSDDPLRMLRAVRFAAQLGFELAPDLLPAMRQLSGRLAPPVVSVERITDELGKMLESERPKLALELLDAGGLLEVVLPEVDRLQGRGAGRVPHPRRFRPHAAGGGAHAARPHRQAGCALPRCRQAGHRHPGRRVHRARGASARASRESALERLRFPQRDIDAVVTLVRLHLRPVYYRSEWS